MFVASYTSTMRNARPLHIREPMQRYGIRREWFPVPAANASSKELIARVAAWHGLSHADIVGRAHRIKWAPARRDAIRAVRAAYPALSLPAIGRLFRRDHSTIYHHLNVEIGNG